MLALSLPETSEQDHFGRPSFRVRARIFATLPDLEHLNVMIDPFDVEAAVSAKPAASSELLWGQEVRGLTVRFRVAGPDLVRDLLAMAWRRKAPRVLQAKVPPEGT